uniref:Uncharacterized protein n=1 Tax=Arundo donax TaxID=35708 RepID=A0A0A8Y356_ARUDO
MTTARELKRNQAKFFYNVAYTNTVRPRTQITPATRRIFMNRRKNRG